MWILFITKNMDNSAWNFNAIWYEFWVRSTIILKTVKKSKKNLFLIFIWHSLESVPRKIIDFEEGHLKIWVKIVHIHIHQEQLKCDEDRRRREREKRDRFHKENCCFKYLKKIFYFVGRIAIRIGHRLWMVHQASSECYFSHLSLTHAKKNPFGRKKLHYFLVFGIFLNLSDDIFRQNTFDEHN